MLTIYTGTDGVSYAIGLSRKDVAGFLIYKLGDPSYRWSTFAEPGGAEKMTKDELEELMQEVLEELLDGGNGYDGPVTPEDIGGEDEANADIFRLLDRLGIK